jgi:hypothetical protein
VEELPDSELSDILHQRCGIAPTYASKMVSVLRELQRRRQRSNVFAGRHGFITPRDLFRWAERGAVGYEALAVDGFCVLGERLRSAEERSLVVEVLESVLRVKLDMEQVGIQLSIFFLAIFQLQEAQLPVCNTLVVVLQYWDKHRSCSFCSVGACRAGVCRSEVCCTAVYSPEGCCSLNFSRTAVRCTAVRCIAVPVLQVYSQVSAEPQQRLTEALAKAQAAAAEAEAVRAAAAAAAAPGAQPVAQLEAAAAAAAAAAARDEAAAIQAALSGMVWTRSLKRLYTLVDR